MADRYWVGGTGTWDSVTTTNWSTTSGGASGASAPTYADNVFFDSNSGATNYVVTFGQSGGFIANFSGTVVTVTGTVSPALQVGQTLWTRVGSGYTAGGTYITSFGTGTGGVGTYNLSVSNTGSTGGSCTTVSACADLTISAQAAGVTATFTGAGQAKLSVYGNFSLPSSGVSFGGSDIVFCSSTTGKTVFTNGISLGNTNLRFDRDGGGWTLTSALTHTGSGSILIPRGDFSTGNFSITAAILSSIGTITRSLSLGSSTVTLSSTGTPVNLTSTGLTFNAGTSTITLSATSSTLAGDGVTFNNVTYSNTTAGTKVITGSNTFANLTFPTRTATGLETVTFSGNQIVSGTLTLSSPSTVMIRRVLRSDVVGVQRTLSVGTAAAFSSVDLRDIAITGAASPISGTSFGNAGNNSGATFTSAKTAYWNLVAGGSWTSTAWATTSGGTPAVANFPLAQDTVVIQDTGLNSGATITATASLVGTLDFSTRTLPMNFTLNTSTAQFFGPIYLSSAVTINGTLGSRTGTADSTYTVTGTAIGYAEPVVSVSVNAIGVLTSTAIGTAIVRGKSVVSPTGVSSSANVSPVTVYLLSRVYPTGVSATGELSSVTAALNATVRPVGVTAYGYTGYIFIWGNITPNQNPNWVPIVV